MTDDLLELLRRGPEYVYRYVDTDHAAADRIEALERERDAAYAIGYGDCENEISLTEIGKTNQFLHGQIAEYRDALTAMTQERDEAFNAAWRNGIAQEVAEARLAKAVEALREIAAEASVAVKARKNGGINHKRLYKGWREIAVERIDIARATLAEMEGGKDE